jgi:orotate phosphoribosyltransferase
MSQQPFTDPQRELLEELLQAGAVLVGDVVRERFGLKSPIYFDLREALYSRPELLWKVAQEFVEKICELTRANPVPQCVVGIPDTATPLALATALYSWQNRSWQNRTRPEIFYALLRKEGKTYPGLPTSYWIGKKDAARCEYNLIDDVLASGLTKRAAAARMQQEGVPVRRIVVLFDRRQGDGLRNEGFEVHGIFPVPDVLDFYLERKLISAADHERIRRFLLTRRFDTAAVK